MPKWKVHVHFSQFGYEDDEFDDNMGRGYGSDTVIVYAETEEQAKELAMAKVKKEQEEKRKHIPDLYHQSEVKQIEKIED